MTIDTRFTENDRDQYGRPMHAETAREARQGPLGRPILYVLLGGLALGAVYLIGTQIWSNTEELPPPNQIQETPAQPVAPAVNMTPAPAANEGPALTPGLAATPTPALTLEPTGPAMTPATPAPAATPAG